MSTFTKKNEKEISIPLLSRFYICSCDHNVVVSSGAVIVKLQERVKMGRIYPLPSKELCEVQEWGLLPCILHAFGLCLSPRAGTAFSCLDKRGQNFYLPEL